MADISFKIENIKMKLKHLNVNKSPGPDNIHPRILSEASEILALPLQILFETSFNPQETGFFYIIFSLPVYICRHM